MADNKAKILRLRQTEIDIKEKAGKVSGDKSNTKVGKGCPTCQNPRWDKTPRKS